MLVHPQFDPIALQIGPLAIRWYGLMYLTAFLAFFLLGRRRLFLESVFKQDNPRFDYDRFSNWIYRRENKLSMKGTKYNPKYMPLGVC